MWFLLAGWSIASEPPAHLSGDPPVYPDAARIRGQTGTVELRLHLNKDGTVSRVELIQGAARSLNDAAIEAASSWVFEAGPAGRTLPWKTHFETADSSTGGIPLPATLHATVRDGNGVTIQGSQLIVRGNDKVETLSTDGKGRVTVPFLEPGAYRIEISAPGYRTEVIPIQLEAGETVTTAFPLAREDEFEYVIYAERDAWRNIDRGRLEADTSTVTGKYELTRRDIESTPGSLEDITRAAHALPGVVSDGDLLAGFHVRGGETSEVVYQLDRVPLENPFHLAGFNSLFNPDMIERVDFYSGAAPAEVPSATSAVMAVESWDGSPKEPGAGFDGAIDLSASSARISLVGPLDSQEKLTVALAARRTYLEGYFQVMKWANVLDTAFAAPEFSELSARMAYRPSHRTRFLFSALRSGDSLAVVDSDDDSLVQIDGAFELDNRLTLYSLDHRYRHESGFSVQTTAARTADRSFQRRDIAGTIERSTDLVRWFARTDAVLPFGPQARVKVGADLSRFNLEAEGDLQDNRVLPSWTQAGIADFGFPLADVVTRPAPWTEANIYAQTEFEVPIGAPITRGKRTLQPGLNVRAGLRTQVAGLTGELLHSPRAGFSVPLPTGTIPKVSIGSYQRVLRDPVQLAPGYGEPDLRAERARHWVVGVDQAIPLPGEGTGGLLRVEAYRIDLTDLVVSPDTARDVARAPLSQTGHGRNQGIDVMAVARLGRFNTQLAYGLLFATRVNPTNTVWQPDVSPPQDQRHTLSIAGDLQLFPHWRMTARYAFHTGRPVSRIRVDDAAAETVGLDCLNCDRLGPTHQIDIRAEWRRSYDRFRLTFYAEVLNVGNIRSQFLPIHDVIDGDLSTTFLNHLPIRPFLGLRADF